MKMEQQLPDSKHFRLQQLAEGVYAAIHIDGGAAIGNAGIVDLGDRTLIYVEVTQLAVGMLNFEHEPTKMQRVGLHSLPDCRTKGF